MEQANSPVENFRAVRALALRCFIGRRGGGSRRRRCPHLCRPRSSGSPPLGRRRTRIDVEWVSPRGFHRIAWFLKSKLSGRSVTAGEHNGDEFRHVRFSSAAAPRAGCHCGSDPWPGRDGHMRRKRNSARLPGARCADRLHARCFPAVSAVHTQPGSDRNLPDTLTCIAQSRVPCGFRRSHPRRERQEDGQEPQGPTREKETVIDPPCCGIGNIDHAPPVISATFRVVSTTTLAFLRQPPEFRERGAAGATALRVRRRRRHARP
jgi:hypothetical protein